MSAIDNTPVNKNFLSQLGFRFLIKKTPNVNFFIQEVDLPEIYLDPTHQPNPFVNIPHSGDHIKYSDLNIRFKVDEDLKNYLEIHNWIKALGFPDNYEQYKAIQDQPSYTGDGILSDVSLLIMTSNKTHNFEVTFKDAFPFNLSKLSFKTTDSDVNYLEASAVFKYVSYEINEI